MKRTYFLFIFIVSILVTAISPTPAAAQVETVIRLDPQLTTVDPGEAFTLEIWVDDVQNLAAFDVTLHFNSNYLNVTKLVLGSFLDPGLGVGEFNNDKGLIHFYNAIISENSEPQSGSGILFTVYFTAKYNPVDTLITIDETLTELVEGDPSYELIPYTAQNASVRIGAGGPEHWLFLPLVRG